MNRDRCAKRRARASRSRASRSLAIQVTGSALGAVRYKAQAYRRALGGVFVQRGLKKFEIIGHCLKKIALLGTPREAQNRFWTRKNRSC